MYPRPMVSSNDRHLMVRTQLEGAMHFLRTPGSYTKSHLHLRYHFAPLTLDETLLLNGIGLFTLAVVR